MRDNNRSISELNGRQIIAVQGAEKGSERVKIYCKDGSQWEMAHDQDCCESVMIEDAVGDPDDLIGTVIDAREDVGETDPDGYTPNFSRDSYTWTFYIIQTDKGAVTFRWLGESPGYYSEGVDFKMVRAPDE